MVNVDKTLYKAYIQAFSPALLFFYDIEDMLSYQDSYKEMMDKLFLKANGIIGHRWELFDA